MSDNGDDVNPEETAEENEADKAKHIEVIKLTINKKTLESKRRQPIQRQQLAEKKLPVVDFNSAVWKAKKDDGISLAAPISGHNVPNELKSIEKALILMHKLE